MTTENRNATCHVRVYDSNGLVMSTNPRMSADELAHTILDIIKNKDNPEIFEMQEVELDQLEGCN